MIQRLRAPHGAIVCVPAHNEAERLPVLLRSLAVQTGFDGEGRLGVVIVANNCTDETVAEARNAVVGHDSLAVRLVEVTLAPDVAHVGTARRMALDTGADWLAAEGMPSGVILSTDADAEVPPNWVSANVLALQRAEIVGGELVLTGEGDGNPGMARLHAEIGRYWRAVREIEDRLDPPAHDPAPRHGDHTGASLALRADYYRAIGGLPAIPSGEDNALVSRVVEAGGRLRHAPDVKVFASDRLVGRASGGMAKDMVRRQAVVRGEEAYCLPHPEHWRRLIERRAALRQAWRQGPAAANDLLGRFGLDDAQIAAIDMSGCLNDIAFVERASRNLADPVTPHPDLPVEEALPLFGSVIEDVRGAA